MNSIRSSLLSTQRALIWSLIVLTRYIMICFVQEEKELLLARMTY